MPWRLRSGGAGFRAWAGGFRAWAGGFRAWAGGFRAWAGGFRAWAGGWQDSASGLSPELPSENDAIWEQIKLKDTHNIIHHFGEGIKVAIIDTGLDLNHEGLQGFLAPSSEWKDFIDGDNLPQEVAPSSNGDSSYGHGTAIAGIIMQVAP
ncbi:MAG: S8 family serine peptidase [Deinococcales bacterium]